MSETTVSDAVNLRYSKLATTSCCLSCGGAVRYSQAQIGEVCVDLGSGRGTDVLRLAEDVGADGYVYGIDISDGMIEKARRRAQQMGIAHAEFIQADLGALPLDDSTTDLVISNCTINHAENKQQVWNEIFRILKPGGRFVISDIYSTLAVPEQYRTDPEAVAEFWAGSVTRDAYVSQLAKAGFQDIEILEESEPYPKGSIEVVSWTIMGHVPSSGSCCSK